MQLSPQIELDTQYGKLRCLTADSLDGPLVVVFKEQLRTGPTYVRIHSSCLFSEALLAVDCDCAQQLQSAMTHVSTHGGYIIYSYQEGRGIGIHGKVNAIALQEKEGLNTVEAFSRLGFPADARSFIGAANTLKALGIEKVVLDTSNPLKIAALVECGIEIVERIRLPITENNKIQKYLAEKRPALGHYEND